MAGELYTSDDIVITPHVARFAGVSYQMANVGSVRVVLKRKLSPIASAIFLLGVAALFAAKNGVIPERAQEAYWAMWIAFGASFVWQSIFPAREYILVLKTSSGDVQAYKTANRKRAFEVKEAIEDGFARRT